MRDLAEELSQEIWGEPDYSKVFNDIAESKYNSGNYEHAIIACQQSLNINPNRYYPLYLQGLIYSFKEDYPLSIYYFSKALKVKKNFYLFLQRGISKSKLKNYEDAINDFKEAISLNPEYTPSYYFMADCKYELENYQVCFDQICYWVIRKHKEMIISTTGWMNSLQTLEMILYELRALCKYEMDYFKDAIEDFNEAIEIKPDDFVFTTEQNVI